MPTPTSLERAVRAVEEQLIADIAAADAQARDYDAYSRACGLLRTLANNEIARLSATPLEITAMPSELVTAAPEPTAEDSESEPAECGHCGESHDSDTAMVTIMDIAGALRYAAESCVEESDDYCAVENRTRAEQRNGVQYFHLDYVVRAADGYTASLAYAESYWYLDENDGFWYTSYEHSSQYEDEQESEERHGNMYDYDTDVLDIHGWPSATPDDSLCFGVELECESRNEDAAELTAALGNRDGDGRQYILKSDGSIDCGTEIVTLPYTLDYHQSRFDWRKVLAPAQGIANSGANTTQCGIHVHINRAAVSALTLGKMLVFVNDPRNVQAITGIAQRSESSWAKFQTKKLTDGMRGKYADERYQALNVKDNTIEVRIFRGNLRAERVLKNIEFCHALVMYCRHASMQSLTWENFWAWLRGTPANCKQYGNLIDFAHEIINKPVDGSTEKDI